MREAEGPEGTRPDAAASAARALVVSSLFAPDAAQRLGRDAYSYHYVYRAFRPLLDRLATVIEVDRAESRLDWALRQARQRGLRPLHLSFLPLERVYISSRAANLAMPFWEFPDLPDEDFAATARTNWVRVANHLSLLLCASQFTADAFRRAGVRTPVHVVPVPIAAPYFSLPPWTAGERAPLAIAAHEPLPAWRAMPDPGPWRSPTSPLARAWRRARALYDRELEPRVPRWLDRGVSMALGLAHQYVRSTRAEHLPPPTHTALALGGVVYTAFVNPFDRRKNWHDLLSAFLFALRDQADATLIVKLVVSPSLAARGLNLMLAYYHRLAIDHRCRLLFITDYLDDARLLELMRATAYAVSATRAEGAGLPLQDALAAARPLIAPAHSALAEYVDASLAFVVDSHPAPAAWPHDPRAGLKTSWHRIAWQSLHDQFQAAHRTATADPHRYAAMAAAGRARMHAFASADAVLPRLRAALDAVTSRVEATAHAAE